MRNFKRRVFWVSARLWASRCYHSVWELYSWDGRGSSKCAPATGGVHQAPSYHVVQEEQVPVPVSGAVTHLQ